MYVTEGSQLTLALFTVPNDFSVNNRIIRILSISAILCLVLVCFYCSILFNHTISIPLARVDVSAGNSLSTPQY